MWPVLARVGVAVIVVCTGVGHNSMSAMSCASRSLPLELWVGFVFAKLSRSSSVSMKPWHVPINITRHLSFYYYVRPSFNKNKNKTTNCILSSEAMAPLTTVGHTNGSMPNEHSLHFHSQRSSLYHTRKAVRHTDIPPAMDNHKP